MTIHIYTIWFPTSKKYYIGQTNDLFERMIQGHLRQGNKSLVGRALWKYDDWQVSVLHTCKTRDEACRIEIEEIRNFNSVNPNGYNLTHGGDGLFRFNHSKESKKKMSEVKKGNKFGVGNKGRTHQSKESKKKISKSKKGHIVTKETRQKISNTLKGRKRDYYPNSHSTLAEYKRLKTRLNRLETEHEF